MEGDGLEKSHVVDQTSQDDCFFEGGEGAASSLRVSEGQLLAPFFSEIVAWSVPPAPACSCQELAARAAAAQISEPAALLMHLRQCPAVPGHLQQCLLRLWVQMFIAYPMRESGHRPVKMELPLLPR